MTITWVSDILQEFVYQYQGFSQFRSTLNIRTNDEIKQLQDNNNIWTYDEVIKILKSLQKENIITQKVIDSGISPTSDLGIVRSYFSCFASVELARLECIVGNFASSIKWLTPSTIGTRIEYITSIPSCYNSMYYHTAVSYIMLRKYSEAIECLSYIAKHLYNIVKPTTTGTDGSSGGGRVGFNRPTPSSKAFDRIMALLVITSALCPGYRVDDQLKELIDVKYSEKLRRLGYIHILNHKNSMTYMYTINILHDCMSCTYISYIYTLTQVTAERRGDPAGHVRDRLSQVRVPCSAGLQQDPGELQPTGVYRRVYKLMYVVY